MSEDSGASPPTVPPSSSVPEIPASKSYANVVTSRPSLSRFDVAVSVVDGKATVSVPEEVFQNSTPLWEDFLVGHFPPDSTAPHIAKIHVIVNKIWNLGDKNIKIDVFGVNETTVKFRIRNESARLRALRRGMWNICDLPMIVSKWTPIAEDAQPEVKTMPMWVLLKNVPHSMFTWKGISYIASPVGHPKRLHQETELVTNFEEAKVFVEVELTKELPKTYYFQVQGEEVCITYHYPWLPPRCGSCRKWGHSEDGCLASLGKENSPVKQTPVREAYIVTPPVSPKQTKNSIETVVEETVEETVAATTTESEVVTVVVPPDAEIDSASAVETVVEVTGNSEKENVEHEAGEIPAEDGEKEWLNVTSSGGKNSKTLRKPLVYGAVRIASPTSFDILRDNDEEGDSLISSLSDNDHTSDMVKTQSAEVGRSGVAQRVPPPRNSKNTHRFLSGSSNKTKDTGPTQVYKRNSQKKP